MRSKMLSVCLLIMFFSLRVKAQEEPKPMLEAELIKRVLAIDSTLAGPERGKLVAPDMPGPLYYHAAKGEKLIWYPTGKWAGKFEVHYYRIKQGPDGVTIGENEKYIYEIIFGFVAQPNCNLFYNPTDSISVNWANRSLLHGMVFKVLKLSYSYRIGGTQAAVIDFISSNICHFIMNPKNSRGRWLELADETRVGALTAASTGEEGSFNMWVQFEYPWQRLPTLTPEK